MLYAILEDILFQQHAAFYMTVQRLHVAKKKLWHSFRDTQSVGLPYVREE